MPQTCIIFLSYIFSKEAQSVYCNEAFTFLFKMFVCRNTALKLFMPSNILLLLMWPCSSFARNIILFNWNNNQRFHALLCSTGKTDCEMCDKIKPFEKHWYFKEWLKLWDCDIIILLHRCFNYTFFLDIIILLHRCFNYTSFFADSFSTKLYNVVPLIYPNDL